ncbi:MAG: DNA protecting protein DprA [Parcubacteria group bacterium RIFCSPLOWO2_01_FULL_40_65]|nr:MAG: DNA protecting protein DprA [Parcubacteria group bacterium RIFCSPHIGHO2_01_FULL_40_30]OHB19286.1 MAG: DNA protecting protein DprA [Parcubacteria group bacterium RIFCSPHIGHO2_02_FULL_40_12]OHB21652.1 MAG: DNA protecting protein DprA [Parcubacteria group bacterium RIFCSPLOWO2_01_FULL_40_65]OHB23371.1 MAG: DNA protecting protein DprA [Parcubacteria group bacterium RIFCSPLOWO2_02_FULL_40_12]OHB24485.1 MAG: DNA protecting protein DprA [Parcubacteria group bacterium RIFCSPLOWO2_12_FULL_40_10]
MTENQKVHLNAFNCIPGVGYGTLKNINEYFKGDFEAGFKGSESHFRNAGIKNFELSALLQGKNKIDSEKEWKKLEKEKVKMIVFDEPEFPKLLKHIPDAPVLFYMKGELKKEDDFCFGIVGTRLATNYGKETSQVIAFKLANAGLTIVSGMAVGIDTEAHKGALSSSGRTIAVVASGLDERSLFPQENISLSRKIIERGAMISEHPIGMKADREKFVSRNRIISGLSKGVLVVEAPLRSGALITARHALEQNREVFAVPGNISSRMSFGANLLLKQGAALVTRAEDILQELNFKFSLPAVDEVGAKIFSSDNKVEEKIFDILNGNGEVKHIDEIARFSGTAVQKINAALTTMEMKGIIKNLGNGQYSLEERYLTPIEDEEI